MKSYLPLLLVLLFVCLSRQQVPFNTIYNEFDKVRNLFCLGPITRDSTLESQARTYANNFCSNPNALPSTLRTGLSITSSGNLTHTQLLSYANTSFYNSYNAWNCQLDSLVNTSFARYILHSSQSVGCSFNFISPCNNSLANSKYFRMVCLFKQQVYTNVRVVGTSNCTCRSTTSSPTTAAPTTSSPTTSSPTTSSPTTAAPTTAAPTTAAPTTAAPTTAAPTTTAPTTTATTTAPTTAPVPTYSPGVPMYQAVNPTPTATRNEWLRIHDTARDCVNLPRLTWDESLAQDALNWARQGMGNSSNSRGACSMFHSSSTSFPVRIGQGENINYVGYVSNSFTFNEVTFITTAVEGWYSEYLNYTCSTTSCSINSTTVYNHTLSTGMRLTLNSCGHYTQMIWRNTTRVGCAYAKCNNDPSGVYKYYGACRYSPAGNVNIRKPDNTIVVVNPLEPNVICSLNSTCNRPGGRSFTSTTVNNPNPQTQTKSFFKSDSEIYVLALSVFILVVVVSIFVIVLINFIKNKSSGNDDYQLLETK